MTYGRFHLIFNLPVFCLLLAVAWRRLRALHWKCIAALCGIVLLATTPWDNWAVHKGIWAFDETRVTPVTVHWRGVDWRLPAEEYAYFLIETVQVALLTLLFLPKPPPANPTP